MAFGFIDMALGCIDTARARKPWLRRLVALPIAALPLALILHSRQAEAQACPVGPEPLETQARDQALFYRGAELREKGRHDEACACFYESQRLAYDPKKLISLAECDERKGQLAAALEKYQEMLQQLPSQPNTRNREDRERKAREGVRRIERRVVRVVLVASPTPGAAAQLDGQPTPLGETRPLDPGVYRVEVSAPGYETHRESLHLVEGQRLEYALPALSPLSPVSPKESSRFGLVPPILMGAGAVLAGLGTYYGLSALASGRRFEACPADDERRCDRLENDWTSKADTATWLWVGAGLVAGAGVTLYVLEPGTGSGTPQQTGASLSAWAGPAAAGVSATGRF